MGAMSEEIRVQGVDLDLVLRPLGPPSSSAVLLVPGLGATPLSFTLHERRSLAQALAAAGHQPWTADFQLHWRRPRQDAGALLRALELGLAELARATRQDPSAITAIGHSLGGILLFALAAREARLRRFAALASGLDYRLGRAPLPRAVSLAPKGLGPLAHGPLKDGLARLGGLPARRLAQAAAPLWGRGFELPFERDQFHPGCTPGPIRRRMMEEGVRDVPLALLLDLAGLFSRQGFALGDEGRPLREVVGRIAGRALLVAAVQDRQCPLASVRDAAARIPGARLLEVGATGTGFGHVDLLTGSEAPERVFAPVIRFLEERDA